MTPSNVCYRGNSGHVGDASLGPLMTQSRHSMLSVVAAFNIQKRVALRVTEFVSHAASIRCVAPKPNL